MAQLGDLIATLLADAARARAQADIEAVKLAEGYSGHELLRHLPVPRFRLPEISVDIPVLVTDSGESLSARGTHTQPQREEIDRIVSESILASGLKLTSRQDEARVKTAVRDSVEAAFRRGPRVLLSSARVAGDASKAAFEATQPTRYPSPEIEAQEKEKSGRFQKDLSARMSDLLKSKIETSPQLQVRFAAEDIKSHANTESLVRIRLTISEDSYEIVDRDADGGGFSLVPE